MSQTLLFCGTGLTIIGGVFLLLWWHERQMVREVDEVLGGIEECRNRIEQQ